MKNNISDQPSAISYQQRQGACFLGWLTADS